MKTWKVIIVLFGGLKPDATGQPFLIERFYMKVAKHLNAWAIGPGEFAIESPDRIRDTDTFKAMLMVFTDKEVPLQLHADRL